MSYPVTKFSYTCQVCGKKVNKEVKGHYSEVDLMTIVIPRCKLCNRTMCKNCADENFCNHCKKLIPEDAKNKSRVLIKRRKNIMIVWLVAMALTLLGTGISSYHDHPSLVWFDLSFLLVSLPGSFIHFRVRKSLTMEIRGVESNIAIDMRKAMQRRQKASMLRKHSTGQKSEQKKTFVRTQSERKKKLNSTVLQDFLDYTEKTIQKQNPSTAGKIYGKPIQSVKDVESIHKKIQKREGKINIVSDSTSYSYTCDVCEKLVKEQLSRPHSEEEIKRFFIKQCKSCNRVICKLCAQESMCWDCIRQIIQKNDQNYFQYRGDTGQPQLAYDCDGGLIKSSDEFMKAMMGVGVLHSRRPFTKRVKQTLWAISQKRQNESISLSDIRKEAGDIISLKIVVETLQEMIENYELEAEFDAVQMKVKFFAEDEES
jgi:hypothetical protein